MAHSYTHLFPKSSVAPFVLQWQVRLCKPPNQKYSYLALYSLLTPALVSQVGKSAHVSFSLLVSVKL